MTNSVADCRWLLRLFPRYPVPALYDRLREVLRARHCSRRTEEVCRHSIRRFFLFPDGTYPRESAEKDLNQLLTHLAVGEDVAASIRNQALGSGHAPFVHFVRDVVGYTRSAPTHQEGLVYDAHS